VHPSSFTVARRRLGFVLLLGGWMAIVVTGLTALWRYEVALESRERRRRVGRGQRDRAVPGRPTLIMWLHPHCPCSSASVEELDRVMAHVGDHVAYTSCSRTSAWRRCDEPALWTRAASIHGVSAVRDVGGVEARRFEVRTSGQTVLYDADGACASRSITGSRGHAGDNSGQQALLAAILGDAHAMPGAPVYGARCDRARGGMSVSPAPLLAAESPALVARAAVHFEAHRRPHLRANDRTFVGLMLVHGWAPSSSRS